MSRTQPATVPLTPISNSSSTTTVGSPGSAPTSLSSYNHAMHSYTREQIQQFSNDTNSERSPPLGTAASAPEVERSPLGSVERESRTSWSGNRDNVPVATRDFAKEKAS